MPRIGDQHPIHRIAITFTMGHATFQNVFRGPDAVAQFFNPDNSPPVPLVEIPDKLNPFRKDGVRIYAKMLTALPGQNVKALPGQY